MDKPIRIERMKSMNETISDIQKRYVWRPLLESYSMPHARVDKTDYQRGHDDGWNAAVAYFKEVGKI